MLSVYVVFMCGRQDADSYRRLPHEALARTRCLYHVRIVLIGDEPLMLCSHGDIMVRVRMAGHMVAGSAWHWCVGNR